MKLSTTEKWQFFGVDIARLIQFFVQGLSQGVPAKLKRAFSRQIFVVSAKVDGDQIEFLVGNGGEAQQLGRWEIDQLSAEIRGTLTTQIERYAGSEKPELALVLDERDVLIHPISLPIQAEPGLRQSVTYQLSRHTPFSEDQVFFDAVIVDRNRTKKQLSVELVTTPKERVQPLINRIELCTGLSVSRLSIDHRHDNINLLGPSATKSRPNRNVYLLGLLFLSLLAAALSPLLHKRMVMLDTKQTVMTLRGDAAGIMEKKLQLEKNIKVLEFLVNKRNQIPKRALIVEELSRIIPDQIYLNSLKIKDNVATLQGQGKDVVSIIEKLVASPLFSAAKFTSTVSRNARTGLDRFSIKLEIKAEAI